MVNCFNNFDIFNSEIWQTYLYIYWIRLMEVELDNFEDGRPMVFKTTQETAQKIKQFKSKKQYREMLDYALAMPSTK